MFTSTQNSRNSLDMIVNGFFLTGFLFSSSVAYVGLTTEVGNAKRRTPLRIVGCVGLVASASIATLYSVIIKNNFYSNKKYEK